MYPRLILFLYLLFSPLLALSQSETLDFSEQYDRIFQIRTVSNDTETKSSIGSGFQINSDGLIVTNYHVVSDYIAKPDELTIQYADQSGNTGVLELLDFDVISDLALLQHPEPNETYLSLSENMPSRGEVAYALGNPGDWGMVMVPGPTNGFVEHSYEKTILFSGSLNGGMSGGPALNRKGEVIGVNVASAGSQLSFLVPVEKLRALVNQKRKLEASDYYPDIAKQIAAWQRPRLQELIGTSWEEEPFFDKTLFGVIRHDFRCWNSSNSDSEHRTVDRTSKSCEAGDYVYIDDDLTTGEFEFSFSHRVSRKLNTMQFAHWHGMNMRADNNSAFEHSSNYICETDFLDAPPTDKASYTRIASCIRAYKKLPGLYDVLMTVLNHEGDVVVKSHLSIAGAEKDQIIALQRRFAEAVQ